MAADSESKKSVSDEDLLARAIPIDTEEAEPATEDELDPIEVEEDDPGSTQTKKIRVFGSTVRHEDKWSRSPNVTGQGAIHVKTFVSKLRLDAITHIDQQINEWLDKNPDYEVKHVSSAIGTLIGKNVEEALFINVWV